MKIHIFSIFSIACMTEGCVFWQELTQHWVSPVIPTAGHLKLHTWTTMGKILPRLLSLQLGRQLLWLWYAPRLGMTHRKSSGRSRYWGFSLKLPNQCMNDCFSRGFSQCGYSMSLALLEIQNSKHLLENRLCWFLPKSGTEQQCIQIM